MSSEQDDEDRQLLEEVLAGVRPESDPRVEELFARRPEARDELAALRAVAGNLDAAGAADRAEFDAAVRAAAEEDVAPIRRLLQEQRPFASAARDDRRRWWLVAAAALLAVLAVGYVALRGSSPRERIILGEYGPGEHALHPSGRVSSIGVFTWNLQAPPSYSFEVRVYAFDDEQRRQPILESGRLSEQRWDPEPRQRERLPDRFLWEVVSYDAFGGRDDDFGTWTRCELSH